MNGYAKQRIESIDVTRGLVMIIMALDHVRDMIHIDSIDQSPTSLATTTPILFFTRWITYLCAPAFVFLAGTSAYLSITRNRDNLNAGSSFLLKRGLYLIVLEFIIVGFGLFFDVGFHTLLFELIATIGFGFIILALLSRMPATIIGVIGIAIIAFHNLLPGAAMPGATLIEKVAFAFFRSGAFPMGERVFVMAYPPIPWLGIMLTGFAAGNLFKHSKQKRRQFFLIVGSAGLLLFILLRYINLYGDPVPWIAQSQSVYSFLSFMNVTKYPPSLVFCLVTLGTIFIFMSFSEGWEGKISKILSTYGRVPMFYFLIHFYLIHLILLVILFAQGFHWSEFDFAGGNFGRVKNVKSGLSLGAVYLIWMGVVLVLYVPCRWFGRYKANHKYWWLKYL
jgi:uncharacterized membrane protein